MPKAKQLDTAIDRVLRIVWGSPGPVKSEQIGYRYRGIYGGDLPISTLSNALAKLVNRRLITRESIRPNSKYGGNYPRSFYRITKLGSMEILRQTQEEATP